MGYNRPNTFSITVGASTLSPADSSNYHFACVPALVPSGTDGYIYAIIPKSGFIRQATITMKSITANGTAEDISMYIRVGTTDYLIATVSVSATNRDFNNYALNIPVAQGDTMQIKMVTPAWVTNPDGCRFWGCVVIEAE